MELSTENVLVGLLDKVRGQVAQALSLQLFVVDKLILGDTMFIQKSAISY